MEGVDHMWTPYKRLLNVFRAILSNPNDALCDLEICLKQYRLHFTNFLRNPPKNKKNRTHLSNALLEGVVLPGHTRKVELSKGLVEEAIILSDMYDLDEMLALELLCKAQQQQAHHPGLTRGLVAVMLYYDGRKAISTALREMFQTISGVSWCIDLPTEIVQLINSYTKSLVEDGNILVRLLELLAELNVTNEFALLTSNRAFGSKRHQHEVMTLFNDIRKDIAMALFNWSAQRGLPKSIVIRLIQQLANTATADADGNLDDVSTIMLSALLYSYDTSVLMLSDCNDNPYIGQLPILSDPSYAKCIYEAIYNQTTWQIPQMDAIIKFSFALTLASFRQVPNDDFPQGVLNHDIIDRDDQLIDDALAGNVFAFMYRQMLNQNLVYSTEFIYRRLHALITDFIDFMHAKVAELRSRASESARTMLSFQNEGLDPPPNLDNSFEQLMQCVAKLYGDKRARYGLCNEYWGLSDNPQTGTNETNAMNFNSNVYIKNPSRAISLFKFIRLASELLQPPIFKSYLEMIAGLTRTQHAARCAYNLLETSQHPITGYDITWDHFLTALNRYYILMRDIYNAKNPEGSMVTANTQVMRISPAETENMAAVMQIMRAVATYDEVSRSIFCENTSWHAIEVLFGLVTCSIPELVKAEIMFALAALSKSKQSAQKIWLKLEESQIIPTLPPTLTGYHQLSLVEDIDHNESRMQIYRLTRGVLQLLHTLFTTHMPSQLGSGPRVPGYTPYLNFVIDNITLKFYNRSYKNPAERWEVGAECFKILHHLLAEYSPKPEDFEQYDRTEQPHPGYNIMLQLHIKTDLLRLILRIIEEGGQQMIDDYLQFNGKEYLEECVLYALLMLEVALTKRNAFFDVHSVANSSILLPGLNRILLEINPRTDQPDHLPNIIKFANINYLRHTYSAINILNAMTVSPDIVRRILDAQDMPQKLEIRQRFIELLESNVQPLPLSAMEDDGSLENLDNQDCVLDIRTLEKRSEPHLQLQIKEAILNLFLQNINQRMPNFNNFLLGIDVHCDFMSHERHQVVIEKQPCCIRTMIMLLERQLEDHRKQDVYCEQSAHIVELIYNLFYKLCLNESTSKAILRDFRLNCNDLLLRHVTAMPFRHHTEQHVLRAMGYLMKCLTIEMKSAASQGQISRYNLFYDAIVSNGTESRSNNRSWIPIEMGNNVLSTNPLNNYCGVDMLYGRMPMQNAPLGLRGNRILECLSFESEELSCIELTFFDITMIDKLLVSCEAKIGTTEHDVPLVNVQKLLNILNDELEIVQSTIASGQRNEICDEIKRLLYYAIKLNQSRMQRSASTNFIHAWFLMMQTLFVIMPDTAMPLIQRKQHVIDIIETIMLKMSTKQPLVKISIYATDAILMLLTNLRRCCYELEDQHAVDDNFHVGCLNDMTMPTASATATPTATPARGATAAAAAAASASANGNAAESGSFSGINPYNHSNFRFILKRIIDWIISSEVKSNKLSINLYSSLLTCLRILKRCPSDEQLEYNEALLDYGNRNKDMATEIIAGYGEKLIDVICHDVMISHGVCSMLSLSCLDVIFEMHAIDLLPEFMERRGYVKHLLDNLVNSNGALRDILSDDMENLRTLYVYESCMAFFTRMSKSYSGAMVLIRHSVLDVLANMSVYNLEAGVSPLHMDEPDTNNYTPTIKERYGAILFPALYLCDSLLNTLGSNHRSVSMLILNFLFSHNGMFENMLRAASPLMSLGNLKILHALTNLFARTVTKDVENQKLSESPNIDRDRLNRLKQIMIVVLGRFTVKEEVIKKMLKHHQHHRHEHDLTQSDNNSNESQMYADDQFDEHIKYYLSISANVSLYCRNVVTFSARDGTSTTSKFLLTTIIQDVTPLINCSNNNDIKKFAAVIQMIMGQLKGSVAYYVSQKSIVDNLVQQRASLPNLTFGPADKQNFLELSRRHNVKRNQLHLAVFIAEQNLLLLWLHLDFYFSNALIYSQENRNSINESSLDPNASMDEIAELKEYLTSSFNSVFCEQLLSTSDMHTVTKHKHFTSCLLRRIKNLIVFATSPNGNVN